MMERRKTSRSEQTLTTLGAFAVLIVVATSQGDVGISTSGCINAYPEIHTVQPSLGTVRIEWTPVLLTSVTGYLVEYTSHCDNRRNTTQVGNVNTTIIRGLYSYSNYTLRMTVVCNSTVSPTFSPPHIFITPSTGVMVAPKNVSVEALNTTTWVLRWQALDPCEWSGESEEYVIVVTDLTAGSEVRTNVSRYHHTVYLVPGRGRSYNVSVSAVNSEGEGPPSTPITFTMDDEPCKSFFCLYLYYIIGAGGAVVIVIAIASFALVCTMLCCCRKASSAKDSQEPSSVKTIETREKSKSPTSHYEDIEMKPHSRSTIENRYEECKGGVTHSIVPMENNPAYQSMAAAAAGRTSTN